MFTNQWTWPNHWQYPGGWWILKPKQFRQTKKWHKSKEISPLCKGEAGAALGFLLESILYLSRVMFLRINETNRHKCRHRKKRSHLSLSSLMSSLKLKRRWFSKSRTTGPLPPCSLTGLLSRYYSCNEDEEALLCIRELDSPDYHPKIIQQAILLALDGKDAQRVASLKLFLLLQNKKVMTAAHFQDGYIHPLLFLSPLPAYSGKGSFWYCKISQTSSLISRLLQSTSEPLSRLV